MRQRWHPVIPVAFIASCLVSPVATQQSSFLWGFNDWNSTTLPQCQSLAIFVDPTGGTVPSAPPYYLVAFEANGIGTVDAVGSTVGELQWTVNHLTGTQLVLTMFDGNGNSGGVLNEIYTVAGTKTGANASCIAAPSTPSISVISNATSTINTCQAVGLSISGGQKPYTVSVAETNSQTTYNMTMKEGDDLYSWVNNLTPGPKNQVIISVFDAAGQYGQSTPLIALGGSSDTHCPTSSFSSNSKSGPGGGSGDGSGEQENHGSSKTGVIAGIVIAAFFTIFFGLIAWFFLRKRRRGGNGPRNGWTIDRSDSIKRVGGRARLPSEPSENDVTPFSMPTQTQQTNPSVHGYAEVSTRGSGQFGQISSDGRNSHYHDRDEVEVEAQNAYAMDSFRLSTTVSSASGSRSRSSGYLNTHSPRSLRVVNEDGGPLHGQTKATEAQARGATSPRTIFQHQDAGAAEVEEIPPAYPGPATGFPGQHR